MYVHDYMAGGLNSVMDSNTREARKLLSVRRLSSVTWEAAENDVEVVSFMMAGARKRGRECPGKDDGNDKTPKKPRQQKQPHGNGIRRRAKTRRRSLRQRLAEKCVVNPDRSYGYQRERALNQEVRKAIER